jgi:16S rRNA C1402 (ribose-2'-O) methylase RsmI
VRNGILDHHWESTDAQTVLPQSRVNNVLTDLHEGLSGGHLGVNKTLNKVWQRYYWLQARKDIEKLCQQCDTKKLGQMNQYKVGALFKRAAIDATRPFP